MQKIERNKSVVFVDDKIKNAFDKLKQGKYEDFQLYLLIDRALDDLKLNPLIGIHIPKKQWPKEYIQKFGINNLWKYDLPNGWRLIYTLKGNEVEIVAIILEWFSHKNYERKFNYKG